MGKNLLVGVGSKARKVKALYVGVGGKARKIKKIYVGVGGKARLAYQSYIPVTGISLTKELWKGDHPSGGKLTAIITPSNATNKTITWTLSDTTHFRFVINRRQVTLGSYTYWTYDTATMATGESCEVCTYGDDYGYYSTITAKSADGVIATQQAHSFGYRDKDGDRDVQFEWG